MQPIAAPRNRSRVVRSLCSRYLARHLRFSEVRKRLSMVDIKRHISTILDPQIVDFPSCFIQTCRRSNDRIWLSFQYSNRSYTITSYPSPIFDFPSLDSREPFLSYWGKESIAHFLDCKSKTVKKQNSHQIEDEMLIVEILVGAVERITIN